MIVGVGVDRVVIDRISDALARFGPRFVARVFTCSEYDQAMARNRTARRLAMLFAGKEAVSKALGTGFRQGVAPKHIEILHCSSGKPQVVLHAGALRAAERAGVNRVHVSLSDDGGIALAFAIAEGG